MTLRHELFLRMVDRQRLIPAGEFVLAAEEFGSIREIDHGGGGPPAAPAHGGARRRRGPGHALGPPESVESMLGATV